MSETQEIRYARVRDALRGFILPEMTTEARIGLLVDAIGTNSAINGRCHGWVITASALTK